MTDTVDAAAAPDAGKAQEPVAEDVETLKAKLKQQEDLLKKANAEEQSRKALKERVAELEGRLAGGDGGNPPTNTAAPAVTAIQSYRAQVIEAAAQNQGWAIEQLRAWQREEMDQREKSYQSALKSVPTDIRDEVDALCRTKPIDIESAQEVVLARKNKERLTKLEQLEKEQEERKRDEEARNAALSRPSASPGPVSRSDTAPKMTLTQWRAEADKARAIEDFAERDKRLLELARIRDAGQLVLDR